MSAEPVTPDRISQACPECGDEIEGAVRGPGSLAFKMGTHRASKHGYRSGGGKARRDGKKPPQGSKVRTAATRPEVVRIVTDAADELSGGKGQPTESEWTRVLGKSLYTISVGFAAWAAETDPTVRNEADRDAIQDYLSLDPRDADEMMKPVARPIAGSKINAKRGRQIADNVEAVAAVVDVGLYLARIRRYYRIRGAKIAATGAPVGIAGPGGVWQPPGMDDAMAPRPPGEGTVIDPGSMNGMVVDAAMVAAIRARQANGAG